MLEPSPITSQIPHTQIDIISLGLNEVLCHDQDTCMTVHTCARSQMPQYNIVNNVWLFSHNWFQGNSMCIDRRQSTQLCPWLWPFWSSKNISKAMKLCLYTTIVLPTAIYAAETWKTMVEITNKLDVFHHRCLRRLLGISWREHISNAEVISRTKMEYLHDIIQKRQWNFAGHILRLPKQRPAFIAMTWVPVRCWLCFSEAGMLGLETETKIWDLVSRFRSRHLWSDVSRPFKTFPQFATI